MSASLVIREDSVRPSCLDAELVLGLHEGHLSHQERRILERHLDTCSACRQWVARMTDASLSTCPEAEAPPPTEDLLRPGRWFGRYRIERILGAGGLGVVYAAVDPELTRMVAIKILRPAANRGQEELEAHLRQEAQALARASHPNVVGVYEVGSSDGQVYLATEYVPGSTLRSWLRAAPRSPREILEVLVRAGRGLQAAHQAGLIHGDIKPDNILIGADGRVRVTDFGLARPVTTGARRTPLSGTPAYMAPEQLAGATNDARSDQYSFAVTLYEALYGTRPFPGRNVAERRTGLRERQRPRAPRRLGVAPHTRAATLRALSVAPDDRFPSLRAMLDELSRPSRRARLALAAAVVLALVATAFVTRQLVAPRGSSCPPSRAGVEAPR
jgi:serine/threonine protein kinase